jgi:hypothetical protein
MDKLQIEQFVTLKCKHSFHSDCFGKFGSNLCSLCREHAIIQSMIIPAGADISGTSRWSNYRPSYFNFYFEAPDQVRRTKFSSYFYKGKLFISYALQMQQTHQ